MCAAAGVRVATDLNGADKHIETESVRRNAYAMQLNAQLGY